MNNWWINRYYGCGLVFPPKLEGCKVLDLGSGAGRDVYILSSLVGDQGYVVGVDMTKEQVSINNYWNNINFYLKYSLMLLIVLLIIIQNNLVLRRQMLNFIWVKLKNLLMILNWNRIHLMLLCMFTSSFPYIFHHVFFYSDQIVLLI